MLEISFDDLKNVVLRLRSSDHEKIRASLQSPACQQVFTHLVISDQRCAIGQVATRRPPAVQSLKAFGHCTRVRDHPCCRPAGHPFHRSQIHPGEAPPFTPGPFQAIDINPYGNAEYTREPACPGSTIAQHIDEVVVLARVPKATAVVRKYRCCPQGGTSSITHPYTFHHLVRPLFAVWILSVHSDGVATCCHTQSQLLCKGFETTVASRNSLRAQDRNAKRIPLFSSRSVWQWIQRSASSKCLP